MNPKNAVKIGLIIISILLLIGLCYFFITKAISNEAHKAKTELIQKAKAVDFNEDSAASKVAGAIHKFSSFKNKVRNKLDSLNIADTSKAEK